MATVHLGRMMGMAGFSRTVAIKRLHPHLASDRSFVAMLLDEARLVVRVRHPNVVPVLDVVQDGSELLLVMEYVQGEPLNVLFRVCMERKEDLGEKMARAIATGMLNGLHAAHEATDETGDPLGLVHRDVSPQNVMVGVDGVTRVLDFGIAKATGRLQHTRDGELKGKTQYMSPEQLDGADVDRRADVYAASVVLWEMLTMRRLFRGQTQPEIAYKVLASKIEKPSTVVKTIPPELDAIVMRGLAREPDERFATAREMAIAIEQLGDLATTRVMGEWVESRASDRLKERAAIIAAIESASFRRASLSALAQAKGPQPNDLPTIIEGASRPADVPLALPSAPPSPGFAPPAPSSGALPAAAPAHTTSTKLVAIVALALFTAVIALGVAVWVLMSARRAPPAVVAVPTATATATATESATAIASATPSATATASATASVSASATVRVRPPPVGPKRLCDPPYTLDARGIRIPKPECL
jgi:serine/threonine-protein kinase